MKSFLQHVIFSLFNDFQKQYLLLLTQTLAMNTTAESLLKAHVAYFLNELKGEKRKSYIRDESKAIYHWVSAQPLSSLVPEQNVLDFAEISLSEIQVGESTKAYAKDVLNAVLAYVEENDIEIDDLISKKSWDAVADRIIAERQIREDLIGKLVNNPFYGELLSEVLYNSIKSFLQQSGPSSDKGIGGLFNVGKGLLGAALSGIEENIDRNVKKFLTENINKTIRDSEKIIKSKLTDAKLKDASNKLWNTLDDMNFNVIAAKIKKVTTNKGGGESLEQISEEIVNDLKKSKAVKEIGELVIKHFYATYGHQPVGVLMNNLFVTEEKVVRESVRMAEPIIQQLISSGFLEERLYQHFKGFYESDEVTKILS